MAHSFQANHHILDGRLKQYNNYYILLKISIFKIDLLRDKSVFLTL